MQASQGRQNTRFPSKEIRQRVLKKSHGVIAYSSGDRSIDNPCSFCSHSLPPSQPWPLCPDSMREGSCPLPGARLHRPRGHRHQIILLTNTALKQAITSNKKAKTATLASEEVEFGLKSIKWNREIHFIILKIQFKWKYNGCEHLGTQTWQPSL